MVDSRATEEPCTNPHLIKPSKRPHDNPNWSKQFHILSKLDRDIVAPYHIFPSPSLIAGLMFCACELASAGVDPHLSLLSLFVTTDDGMRWDRTTLGVAISNTGSNQNKPFPL